MEILRPTSRENQLQLRSRLTNSRETVPYDLEDLYCILQLEPNDSLVAYRLAEKLCEKNRWEEAYRILQNVLKIDHRFETLFALARVEYHLELEDAAFIHLQQSLMLVGDRRAEQFEIFKMLGNIFVRRGDFDSAEDSYNKAHRLEPNSDVLYVNLGTLCIQRQKWDEAVEKFRSALAINMVNDKAWVGLAIGHRMKGDIELSWGNLENALEYNPLNEVALTLALDWGLNGEREIRVLELLRRFLLEGGWDEKFSLAFAWLSWRYNEFRAARLELERLLSVNPQNVKALQLEEQMRAQP